MRRKSLTVSLVLFLLLGASLHAAGPAVFTIYNGFLFGYNLAAEDIGVANTIGFAFSVSENLRAGALYQNGDGTVIADGVFFMVNYAVFDGLVVSIQPGRYNANPAIKAGFSYDIFSRTYQQLYTTLVLSMDYLADTTLGIEDGIVTASLSVSFGL